MSEAEAWYVVKQADGHCAIVAGAEITQPETGTTATASTRDQWGPFASESEAIARRVGLIRSGKCQPS